MNSPPLNSPAIGLVLLASALCLAGCDAARDAARDAINYGKGPFDSSPAAGSGDLLDGLHESSWGNSGRWGSGVGVEGATLFVTNKRGNDLSVINLETGEESARVPTCTNPHELAVSPDGRHLAVGCYAGTTLDILDIATLGKVASLDLGENARPHGVVWHASGDLYATAEGRQSIFRVEDPLGDAPKLSEFATNKTGSHMIAVAPDASAAWTTDLGSKTVSRIDLQTQRAPVSVTVGEEPEGIWLAPDGKALWVSARGSNQAFELDPVTMKVRKTVSTGRFPLRLAIRPQGDVAVTSNLADGTLSVIDLDRAQVVRTIPVSGSQEAQTTFQVTILWSRDGRRIYVAETGTSTVAEVDYARGIVMRRIAVGDGGDGLAIRPAEQPS